MRKKTSKTNRTITAVRSFGKNLNIGFSNHTIKVYRKDGKFEREFCFPENGTTTHFFFTFDQKGTTWVSKGASNRIQVFDSKRTLLREIILEKRAPSFFIVNSKYIIGPSLKMGIVIVIYNLDGQLLSGFGDSFVDHLISKCWSPSSMLSTSDGRHIVVTLDKLKSRPENAIQIFDC
jgi:hypothetical protein